jgi:hypothetical protein
MRRLSRRRGVWGCMRSRWRCEVVEQQTPAAGTWVRILSGMIIALMIGALLYATLIGLLNLQRIGV